MTATAPERTGGAVWDYDHRRLQARWSAEWERAGLFQADPGSDRPPFSIVLPPPSLSAPLHLGHALQAVVQDVIARHRRMAGFEVLWLPGLDHAPIATQRAIEKELAAQGRSRQQVGRAGFAEELERWNERVGRSITADLRALGASLDWSRLRFTDDEASDRAVRVAFVRLWDAGLVYRDLRVVHWCAGCAAVRSTRQLVRHPRDRESFTVEVGLTGGGRLAVQTYRPELLPAAVAVVADPEQVDVPPGARAELPLAGSVPVLLDGTACRRAKAPAFALVPGHDAEHWSLWDGPTPPVVLDRQGRLTVPGHPELDGLPVPAAREAALAAFGRHRVERTTRPGSALLCEHCGGGVEPVATRQWFVSMERMAERARQVQDGGRPRFHPARYGTDHRRWLDGLHDWCISRQLWVGQPLPVFTCGCGHQWAAVQDPDCCPRCGAVDPAAETDVLDAWFAQAIWQSSALGWPDPDTAAMAFHPTALTVTSRDALRLGLSRMIMVGLELTDGLPFQDVVITCVLLTPDGRKMDTARGTAICPGDLVESAGADALRGWAATAATIGQDVCFDPGKVKAWRRTVIKLWNAARLVLAASAGDPGQVGTADPADAEILDRLDRLTDTVTAGLETYQLHDAARALTDFVRRDLDRYLQQAKPRLYAGEQPARETALAVLDVLLRLLHPFLPFVTEELWHRLPGERSLLERCPWPGVAKTVPTGA